MIVVDTNVVVYVLIPGDRSAVARRVRDRDGEWTAPRLWRSEFRNVLVGEMRAGRLDLDTAVRLMRDAEMLVEDGDSDDHPAGMLRLAAMSRCTAYDCEFVTVARSLGVPLVTADRALLAAFPDIAVSLDAFAGS